MAGLVQCNHGLAGAVMGWNHLRLMAVDAAKVSKASVRYADASNDEYECRRCAHFERPGSCERVEGVIKPGGWCKLWTKRV